MASLPVLPRIELCGVHFTPIDREALKARILATVQAGAHEQVLHVNVHAVNLAQQDGELRAILSNAPVTFCDGFGIRLGAALLGKRVPPRITYADWTWELAEFATRHGLSLYLLGSRPGVAERAAAALQGRFAGLKIAGTHHGYFDKSPESAENEAVVAAINAARPDILIVCFGMPLQERWLAANWDRLTVPVAMSGGAALDYVAGELRRGPHWMTDHGLEWLARLLIEPRRLWQRYIIGNPVFLLRVLRQRLGLFRLGG
jgi:N-acetylglucosaminyldiphosphoundecaprenol N-acetyl-beta-D-mannosaminyltransferase